MACSTSCPAGQMLCGEGRCLEERFVCDGRSDCGQGEDEVRIVMMVGMSVLGSGELVQKLRSRTVAVMLEMA